MSLPFDISEKLKSVQVRHYVEWLGRDSHCGYGFAFGYYGGRPMKLREYHPLSEMERVPAEELPKRLDELFDRMDKENVGFVVTEEGKDSCVFCPYKWFELEYETIEVAVDEVLLAQIKEIITPLGWTVERLIVRFLEWLVDPETQEEAIAWLMKAKEELGEK